jgi:membrane protease subunit HflK
MLLSVKLYYKFRDNGEKFYKERIYLFLAGLFNKIMEVDTFLFRVNSFLDRRIKRMNIDLKYFKLKPLYIVIIITIILLVYFFVTTGYQVDKDEMAVITRFGKFIRDEGPGLHFKIPFGIENVTIVPVKRVIKEEFGFKTIKSSSGRSEFLREPEHIAEARMLTADLKVIQIEWIVQYRINDPKKYLFNVRYPEKSLRKFSIIAMSQVAGDYLFDEIITIAKNEMTIKVRDLLQNILDKTGMGINIATIELINVTPPAEVVAAYNEVLQAQQEKDKIINEAKQEYNKTVIPVKGQADRMIAEAEGYKAEKIKTASGDVAYFNALYREYLKAPELTKNRIYLETMSKVIPKMDKVYIIDEKQRNLIPLFQMETMNKSTSTTVTKGE